MSDRRELARREAREVFLAGAFAVVGSGAWNEATAREVELRFDEFWRRTSRRKLQGG